MSRASLDWSDPIAVSEWLTGLRLSFNDADAVALDMLRPARSRELGPALHRDKYRDARAQIIQALDYEAAPEAAPSDPAGSSGSPVD
jgi:hypothetical protein